MNEWSFWLILLPVIAIWNYWKFKEEFEPQRLDPLQDFLGIGLSLAILAYFFWATVFEHPEARLGCFLGLACGLAIGFFDLGVTRVRNTPAGVFVWSSRLVTALFLFAGIAWSATHGGQRHIDIQHVADNPTTMFFCTTLVAYTIVFVNGLYSGRRFTSMPARRRSAQRAEERVESGRRRGRR